MSSPIIFEDNDYFRLDFGDDYEIITISPPLIFNSTGDQVGVSIWQNDRFKIVYFSGHYGVSIVTIPINNVKLKKITEPNINAISSNSEIIEAYTSRNVPEITFDFPSISTPINLINGIHIDVLIERAPSIALPLLLSNLFPVIVKTSPNLYYDSDLNKIFFIYNKPDLSSNDTFEEWFEIIPAGSPNNILNKLYVISVEPSDYTISPIPGSQYVYTTTSLFQPLRILNSEFREIVPNSIDHIWSRNTLYILCDTVPKNIFTFNVYSEDNSPIFELMNNNTYFEINSNGVLRSKGISHIDPQTYEIQIMIRNNLNEFIDVRFIITCYDIFSEYYFQSYMEDINVFRKISIATEIPGTDGNNNSLSMQKSEIKNLSQVVYIILQNLAFMIQQSIYIEFKISPLDITLMGNILVYGTQEQFLNFLLGKIIPTPVSSSLLYLKLESLSQYFFPFLKNFIRAFTISPNRENTYSLNTDFGNMFIQK